MQRHQGADEVEVRIGKELEVVLRIQVEGALPPVSDVELARLLEHGGRDVDAMRFSKAPRQRLRQTTESATEVECSSALSEMHARCCDLNQHVLYFLF